LSAWVEGEAIAWSGDSGGPAFLEDKLVGVNSGGTCCRFGSTDQFARVGSPLAQAWIMKALESDDQSDLPSTNCEAWKSSGGRKSGVSSVATMVSMVTSAATIMSIVATASFMF